MRIVDIDVHVDVEHGGKRMCRRGRGRGRGCCSMRGKTWGPDARSTSPKRKVPAQKEKSPSGSMTDPIVVDKVMDCTMETKDSGTAKETLETEEITSRTEQIMLTDKDADGTVKETAGQPQEPKKLVRSYYFLFFL